MVAPERHRELPGPRLRWGQREGQSGCPLPHQTLPLCPGSRLKAATCVVQNPTGLQATEISGGTRVQKKKAPFLCTGLQPPGPEGKKVLTTSFLSLVAGWPLTPSQQLLPSRHPSGGDLIPGPGWEHVLVNKGTSLPYLGSSLPIR